MVSICVEVVSRECDIMKLVMLGTVKEDSQSDLNLANKLCCPTVVQIIMSRFTHPLCELCIFKDTKCFVCEEGYFLK